MIAGILAGALGLLWFGLSVGMVNATGHLSAGFFLVVVGGGTVLILLGSMLLTVSDHSSDLGTVRAYNGVIEAYQQQISDLRELLRENFGITKADAPVLVNADSPVASVVASLKSATSSVAEARSRIARAQVSIAGRKAGVYWFIVSIYGEK